MEKETFQKESFPECYRIIQHFMGDTYFYCLCDLYKGCQTYVDFIHRVRSYCSICKVYNHYSIDDLHQVKKDMRKLIDFYKSLTEDLLDIEKVGGKNVIFWEDNIEFKFRKWKTGKLGSSLLKD